MELLNITGLWITTMGKTIVHSIWIGLLILVLLRIILHRISLKLSGLRYGISLAALLLLLISVATTFFLIHDPLLIKELANSNGSASTLLPPLSPDSSIQQVSRSSLLFSVLTYFYMAGVLFMLLRSLVSMNYLRSLGRISIPVAPEWQSKFSALKRSLGLKSPVQLLESTRVSGPMLLGMVKPMIIVPAGMLTNLPVGQIETILMHELYHLKRKDYLVNIVQLIIESILFYNPAVWIISGYVRNEREHCCDDGVIHATSDPLVYARALIQVADQQQFTRLSPAASGTTKHNFSTRIKRILNKTTMKTNMRDRVVSLAFLTASLILLLIISSFSKGPSIIRSNEMPGEIPTRILPDTIPQKNNTVEEGEAREAMEEVDWEEIREVVEANRQEALEALEEIDWDKMKEEMEAAHKEAMEEMKEIDWDKMKLDMDSIRKEIESIDWDEVRIEMEQSISDMKIDMEDIKQDIENSMNEIDWEEMRKEIEESKEFCDSIILELGH